MVEWAGTVSPLQNDQEALHNMLLVQEDGLWWQVVDEAVPVLRRPCSHII